MHGYDISFAGAVRISFERGINKSSSERKALDREVVMPKRKKKRRTHIGERSVRTVKMH